MQEAGIALFTEGPNRYSLHGQPGQPRSVVFSWASRRFHVLRVVCASMKHKSVESWIERDLFFRTRDRRSSLSLSLSFSLFSLFSFSLLSLLFLFFTQASGVCGHRGSSDMFNVSTSSPDFSSPRLLIGPPGLQSKYLAPSIDGEHEHNLFQSICSRQTRTQPLGTERLSGGKRKCLTQRRTSGDQKPPATMGSPN